jgi:hypothetical protein
MISMPMVMRKQRTRSSSEERGGSAHRSRDFLSWRCIALALCAAALLAACGGDDESSDRTPAGAAPAMPTRTPTATAEENCDSGRAEANATYEQCVGNWLANAETGTVSELSECREKYAATWTELAALATPPCKGNRFVDSGNGTVSDNLTGLVWEQKTGTVDSPPAPNYADPHEVDNLYTWSNDPSDGDDTDNDGTVFTDFLANLNAGGGFAGTNDWRLPTLAELLTLLDEPFPCTASPCIDGTFGPTQSDSYWSSTTLATNPAYAWVVWFDDGSVGTSNKSPGYLYVRAVRGGL